MRIRRALSDVFIQLQFRDGQEKFLHYLHSANQTSSLNQWMSIDQLQVDSVDNINSSDDLALNQSIQINVSTLPLVPNSLTRLIQHTHPHCPVLETFRLLHVLRLLQATI